VRGDKITDENDDALTDVTLALGYDNEDQYVDACNERPSEVLDRIYELKEE